MRLPLDFMDSPAPPGGNHTWGCPLTRREKDMKSKSQTKFNGFTPPGGEVVEFEDGKPVTPTNPIIPFIEGDGIGRDISSATRQVIDAAVALAYEGKCKISWFEVFAGGKAHERFGEWLPEDTIAAIRKYGVAVKGPLTTPTGGGIRSLNVALRQRLDLYSCIRPVRHIKGVPSVLVAPDKLDVVIFRENTEDVYAGIEFEAGSDEARKVYDTLAELGTEVSDDTGIGIKVISRKATRRIVRRAIKFALENGRDSVTLVHKGNIQKFTEGAFALWGYELAKEEFGDVVITEEELWSEYDGVIPAGKLLVNDRIADAIFYELLINPEKYSVVVTPNLNGDYLSDACAAQVGGLGVAPGVNSGDCCAIFEAVHGTAQTIADMDVANPSSLILSCVLMLEYLGWDEAANLVMKSIERTIGRKMATADLTKLMKDGISLKTSEFASVLIDNMEDADEPEAIVLKPEAVGVRSRTCDQAAAMPKVSVVGAGGVGATCAQYIANQNLADVVLVDIAEGIPQGKSLDLLQAGALLGSNSAILGSNDIADTAGSDIIVITAGLARKPGMSRDDLLKVNAGIVKSVAEQTSALSPDAIYIVVTNPLDVMAHLVRKTTGLPASRVIGMAGALDSARFKTFIASELDVAMSQIEALVLGGHGDLMVPVPRFSTVSGVPITELMDADRVEALCERTRHGGAEIVGHLKSGSAFYAPGASVTQMVEAILKNNHRLIPSSVFPDGKYKLKGDLHIGLPVILGRDGVHEIVELRLKRAEQRALKASAESVRATIKKLEDEGII